MALATLVGLLLCPHVTRGRSQCHRWPAPSDYRRAGQVSARTRSGKPGDQTATPMPTRLAFFPVKTMFSSPT